MKKIRKIFVNILCGFIPNRQTRKRLRITLNNPIIKQMTDFAKSFSNKRRPNIKHTYGFRCANIVITVDNKWVFKFPLADNGKEISVREKRITDALRPISPIKIPKMEILNWNGMYVRKYEYIPGVGFNTLSRNEQNKRAEKLAKQLAQCLYVLGNVDPCEIRDLKSNPKDKPAIMHGWNQNDLWDNFLIDPKNSKIVGLIDWESAGFNDFYNCFTCGTGNDIIKIELLQEYLKLLKK